nr:MAG TPA: hypothetical protein [Microviridae sp.]
MRKSSKIELFLIFFQYGLDGIITVLCYESQNL